MANGLHTGTDEYGRTIYLDPITGREVSKGEAYGMASTITDPETGRRKDVGDSGKRTQLKMFGVKQDMASAKYDVGNDAARGLFREEAGIGFDEELKGGKFRRTRRKLARQDRKRERGSKKFGRLQRRAKRAAEKGRGAKATRLHRRAGKSLYEGPETTRTDAEQYMLEDYARASKKQQGSNIYGKVIETGAKMVMMKGGQEMIQGVRGAEMAAKATDRVDEISQIEEGARTAKQVRHLAKAQKTLADPTIQKAVAKKAAENAGKSASEIRQIGGEAWKAARLAQNAAPQVAAELSPEELKEMFTSPTGSRLDSIGSAASDAATTDVVGGSVVDTAATATAEAATDAATKELTNLDKLKDYYKKAKKAYSVIQPIISATTGGGDEGGGITQGPTVQSSSQPMAFTPSVQAPPPIQQPLSAVGVGANLSGLSESIAQHQISGIQSQLGLGGVQQGQYDPSDFINKEHMASIFKHGGRYKPQA